MLGFLERHIVEPMMRTCILTELGIIVYEGGGLKKTIAFSRPAIQYMDVKRGRADVAELASILSGSEVQVNDAALREALGRESVQCMMVTEDEERRIQSEKPRILVEANLAQDERDAMERLRAFAVELSSSTITEVSGSPDMHAVQAIGALDDMDKMINALGARMREWYGLHFPELDGLIDGAAGYARIVQAGRRADLSPKVFTDAGFADSKVQMLELLRAKSRGAEITDGDLSMVHSLASQVRTMNDLRKNLEDHLEAQMRTVAPNVTVILGTTLSARLIAKAGGLNRLAMMPSSTIQVLGAEKALFRSIKTGTQPPKHGLLFQHPLVHAAPRWQRGKIARAVAAKTAIAARIDLHTKELNSTLLEKLNIRVSEIDKKYAEPPEQPAPAPRRPAREGFRHSRKGKKRKRFGRR